MKIPKWHLSRAWNAGLRAVKAARVPGREPEDPARVKAGLEWIDPVETRPLLRRYREWIHFRAGITPPEERRFLKWKKRAFRKRR